MEVIMSFGEFFSYVMGAVIVVNLYRQLKDKKAFEKLEGKLDELKNKLDK
jgi:hypothetical protein